MSALHTPRVEIAFLGVDGAGKTTQSGLLWQRLRDAGILALLATNDVGRPVREAISDSSVSAESELVAWAVAKTASLLTLQAVAATCDAVTVVDRHVACHLATDRLHGTRQEEFLRRLNRDVRRPSLAIYLDLAAGVAAHRTQTRTGGSAETADVLGRYAEAYRALPEFGSFKVIDASPSQESVAQAVAHLVASELPELASVLRD